MSMETETEAELTLEERLDALEAHVALMTENMKMLQAAMLNLIRAQQSERPTILSALGDRLN